MSKRAVFCIANTYQLANRIVEELREAGFPNYGVSVLFPETQTTQNFAHERDAKASEGIAAGAGTGGVVGGALGWLAGIGVLAIPGIGPFIAAGPIMAALSGAAVGATIGGITGGLVGLGFPEIEARRYEGKIKDGSILLSVHSEITDESKAAEIIFKNLGAQDICMTAEATIHEERPT